MNQNHEQMLGLVAALPPALPRRTHEPSSFTGDPSSFRLWLFQIESEFFNRHVPEAAHAARISTAASYLADNPLRWHIALMNSNNPPLTWENYRLAISERYTPQLDQSIVRDKLASIRQGSQLMEPFITRFETLTLAAVGVDEESLIGHFIRALSDKRVVTHLAYPRPVTSRDAITRARAVDLSLRAGTTDPHPPRPSAHHPPANANAELSTISSTTRPRLSKLTPEERIRCAAQGLCFMCRQHGHMANVCPNRLNK